MRYLSVLLGFLLVLTAIGCGGSGKTVDLVPATGKVTLGDGPLTSGVLTLHPDESKGNNEKWAPTAMIQSDGSFKLTTDGRDGAPVGWYKVTVSQGMGGSMPTESGVTTDPSKALGKSGGLNTKYSTPASSGIGLEITQTPPSGGYAIKLYK